MRMRWEEAHPRHVVPRGAVLTKRRLKNDWCSGPCESEAERQAGDRHGRTWGKPCEGSGSYFVGDTEQGGEWQSDFCFRRALLSGE